MLNSGSVDENYVVKGRTVNFFPDGSLQIVEYVADKYGYHPKITFMTSHQLRNVQLDTDESALKPMSKIMRIPQDFSKRINRPTDEETLIAHNIPLVDRNLVRVSPVLPDIGKINTITKAPFGLKENSSVSPDDDYDYDDIHNRIGGGTAAALLGIG